MELGAKKELKAEEKKDGDHKEKALLNAGLSIRDSDMKRGVPVNRSGSALNKKKRNVSNECIDLTDDRELELLETEGNHRRDMDNSCPVLDERHLASAEENKKVYIDLMRALITKFQ